MDLIELLKRHEGKSLEFKRDLSSPENVLRTLVAFANTSGGTLLVGVEDKTRRVCGVKDPLTLEEQLANLISDSIVPRLLPEIEILPWRHSQIVAVQVFPSPVRPHHVKSLGPKAGVFVRVGSTNRQADESLIAEFRRYVHDESFDETPMPELRPGDIDFQVVREAFSGVREVTPRDLKALRLVTLHQGREVPTVGGILLFGKDRPNHFPDAWIQAGLFEGSDRDHIIDSTEIHNHLHRAVEDAIAFIKRHIQKETIIGEVRRKERWGYPMEAVREAIINALAHADYSQRGAPIRVSIFSDRLEIANPGLLPFGLTVEDIKKGASKLRNRVIGRVFKELELIEQWGSGIHRMTTACRDAGMPDPIFEEIATQFRVTMKRANGKSPVLDATGQAVLDLLKNRQGLSTRDIAAHVKRSSRATRMQLQKLIDYGLIVEVGKSRNDPHRGYYLAEK
jgi:predicted HTH transcriptional regulator